MLLIIPSKKKKRNALNYASYLGRNYDKYQYPTTYFGSVKYEKEKRMYMDGIYTIIDNRHHNIFFYEKTSNIFRE